MEGEWDTVRDMCTPGLVVGQLMQRSQGMMRTSVFTLNVMDPFWGVGLSRGELIWSPRLVC